MSLRKGDLFAALFNAYKKAYPEKKPEQCQSDVVEKWNIAKKQHADCRQFEAEIKNIISSCQQMILKRKSSNIVDFFQPKVKLLLLYIFRCKYSIFFSVRLLLCHRHQLARQ